MVHRPARVLQVWVFRSKNWRMLMPAKNRKTPSYERAIRIEFG